MKLTYNEFLESDISVWDMVIIKWPEKENKYCVAFIARWVIDPSWYEHNYKIILFWDNWHFFFYPNRASDQIAERRWDEKCFEIIKDQYDVVLKIDKKPLAI